MHERIVSRSVRSYSDGLTKPELTVQLSARGPDGSCLGEDTVDLIRRLAENHPDEQIAAILTRQGHRTGTGLPFLRPRVRATRFRAESRPKNAWSPAHAPLR